jgi:hypothetical protein
MQPESPSYLVTVALVGEPKSPPPGSADWEGVWAELPKTSFSVEDEATLAEIFDHAAEALGAEPFMPFVPLSEIVHWIAFEDDSGRPLLERRRTRLTLLDDDGRAIWNVRNWSAVPFGQLQRSAEAGIVPGDPRRIYLIRQVPQGDGAFMVESWRVFLEVLALARDGFERTGSLGETAGGLAFLYLALKKGLGTIQRLHARWAQRGAKPLDLREVLPGANTDAELARRLDCSENDAALVREILHALESEEPLLRSFRQAIGEADSLSSHLTIDYRALFRIRLEELKAGRSEPEGIPLEQMSIDLDQWEEEHFELPGQ